MGYKDEKWREAPGYCVECDRFQPLNNCAVCEECWNAGPLADYEDWEEDLQSSQWYYRRGGSAGTAAAVKSYIFVTDQGFTFQPKSESAEPDVENLQVLGIAEGRTPEEALDNLLAEHDWILETTFSRTFCYELAPNARREVREFGIGRA